MSVLPAKVIPVAIGSVVPATNWTVDDGSSDPWYNFPYEWDVTIAVNQQPHSSHQTRVPFAYDGLDITVGMWLSDIISGRAVKIISITSQTFDSLECRVQDVDRYNTFTTPVGDGNGMCDSGNAYVFELGSDGLPIMGPLSNFASGIAFNPAYMTDLTNRFRHRNLLKDHVRVYQAGHTMTVGEVIRPDFDNPGQYVKAAADAEVDTAVGVIHEVGTPGPDWFTFRPLGRVVEDVEPGLSGNPGDFFYVHPTLPGQLTNVKPSAHVKPVYMRLDAPNRAILLDRPMADSSTTKRFVVMPEGAVTEFTLPADAADVLTMAINGIETDNFTFDFETKVLTFDPAATGYGTDAGDEVTFMYRT